MMESEKQETNIIDQSEKQAEIDLKALEAREKKINIEVWENKRLFDSEQRTNIEKIECLRRLLEGFTVDEEKTILGSEPFIKPIFNKTDSDRIKLKIFSIIDKF